MPEETSGAFWKETLISPRNPSLGKNLSLPIKKELDPRKYGGYNEQKFAYFFVYAAKRIKKKEEMKEYVFASVPVRMAALIAADSNALVEFAKADAEERGLKFAKIVREKVYKYQLIEVNNERLYITGLKSVRNATQIALSQDLVAVFSAAVKGEEVIASALKILFDEVVKRYQVCAKRLGKQLNISNLYDGFYAADNNIQAKAIASLVAIANSTTNMIDLSGVGGSKTAGNMQPNLSSEMNKFGNKFAFIDQSVTGMFERKTYL